MTGFTTTNDDMQRLFDALDGELNRVNTAMEGLVRGSGELERSIGRVSENGLKPLVRSLEDVARGSKTVKDALRDMLRGILKDVVSQVSRDMRGGSSGGGIFDAIGSALGGIFSGAGFRAGGGMVGPGRAFMVGERGPELLVTGRTAGVVVPQSGGAGSVNAAPVNITILNTARADVTARERTGPGGERDIEIMIDDMVSKALRRPASRTGKVLQSVYGVKPSLRRR